MQAPRIGDLTRAKPMRAARGTRSGEASRAPIIVDSQIRLRLILPSSARQG